MVRIRIWTVQRIIESGTHSHEWKHNRDCELSAGLLFIDTQCKPVKLRNGVPESVSVRMRCRQLSRRSVSHDNGNSKYRILIQELGGSKLRHKSDMHIRDAFCKPQQNSILRACMLFAYPQRKSVCRRNGIADRYIGFLFH